MLRRFAHVDRFSWAQQALNAKIPAPVEDARILKVARRGRHKTLGNPCHC